MALVEKNGKIYDFIETTGDFKEVDGYTSASENVDNILIDEIPEVVEDEEELEEVVEEERRERYRRSKD